ncbi:MAG: chemotaxis protein CheB [Sandaracinaceae bacterium]
MSPPSFPIVGIGASAGGLESLERLFATIPPASGAAYVVVQHLAPDHPSLMVELMRRFTPLPVEHVSDGVEVRSDHIYLLPPGKELELEGACLRIYDRDARVGVPMPIDRFLTSLAATATTRAIAVILSGSGTDGSRGVRRVHETHGYVLVEDPASARFDGMPRSTIETGIADVVADAQDLGRALSECVREIVEPSDETEAQQVRPVVDLLRNALEIDFSLYKLPTVLRRISRRAQLKQAPDVATYVSRLETDPDELFALGHDLLIGVTTFFRDPATWEVIETNLVPKLVEEADPARGIRAWVAGCATGEEAYSMACILRDAAPHGMSVKVFATDVHARALEIASAGVYDEERLANVDPERLRRYFARRQDGRMQVTPELRHLVVFASHNVLKDAPFTNLDLVSCRNLLIYFRPIAQRQALSLLQFGLRIGGGLVLGPSESLADFADDYERFDDVHRIYVRKRLARRIPNLTLSRHVSQVMRAPRHSPEASTISMYDAVLEAVMPPSFLAQPDRTLVESFAGAEKLLHVAPRRMTGDLAQLVPEPARLAVAGAFARVAREEEPVRVEGLEWPTADDESAKVDILVRPLRTRTGRAVLVTVETRRSETEKDAEVPVRDLGELSIARVAGLEHELAHARESLHATIEELETTGEEMQATNEELTASNEELQSTNEELHSVNEELHTVNAELQVKIRELTALNRDMRQLFESIDIALVFLDGNLRIRRFTPAGGRLFGLVEHDVGRPLASFRHPLTTDGLMNDITQCREDGQTREYEASDVHGHWHLVRIHPDGDAGEGGVVVSLTDITPLLDARRRAHLLTQVVDSSADAVIALDLTRRITVWNRGADALYGYEGGEMLGRSIDDLVPEELRGELSLALARAASGTEHVRLVTEGLHEDGRRIPISSVISPIKDANDALVGFSKLDRDEVERRRREADLIEREARLAEAFERSPDMLSSIDLVTGRLLDANQTMLDTLGYSLEQLKELHFTSLFASDSQADALTAIEALRTEGSIRSCDLTLKCADGSTTDVSFSSTAITDASGRAVRSRDVLRDVSVQRRATEELKRTLKMREHFLAIVSHELRTPMHAMRTAIELLDQPGETASESQRALGVLSRQSAHMSRLLDDLLDVARIADDEMDLARKPFDLREVIRDAVDAWTVLYEQRDVTLTMSGLDAELPTVGDAARIQQALSNVIDNALRHSRAGQRVRVAVERTPKVARIRVSDQGDGLTPSQLVSVFEPFAPDRDARKHHGSLGLGMTIAKRIVEQHAGTITASSSGPGMGATFLMELPLEEGSNGRSTARTDDSAYRIVLIEDQRDAREMLAMVLSMSGHTVVTAENAEQGIAAILSERPEIALVDIGLPDHDGYHVARMVRDEIGDSVPMIALTGYGQPKDIANAMEAGFRLQLTKPVSTEALCHAMGSVVAESMSDRR